MEIRYYLGLLRRWWWVLLACVLVAGVPAYLLTQSLTPTYRASTLVFVNVSSGEGPVYQDALLSQQLVLTYSQMTQQPVVLEEVRDRLHLNHSVEELKRMTNAQPRRDTQLFEINVTGGDPNEIRDVANAVAEVFIEQQAEYLPEGQSADAVRIAQPALTPADPIAPNLLRNVILAAFAGLLVAGAGIMLYEYLDDTIKSPETLEAVSGLPTLGLITYSSAGKSAPGIPGAVSASMSGPASESLRLVRTNLDFAMVDQPAKSILVTSSNPEEGKSSTVSGLALVMAQAGKRVILVDADLRTPMLHRLFQLPNYRGLSDMLLWDEVAPQYFLQETRNIGLRVITSGPLPPNPAELLASPRLQKVVDALTERADIVLIDSSPVLAVADPVIIASRAGGTVLIIDTRKTRPDDVRRAVAALSKSGTRLLGGVLNKLSQGAAPRYYHSYYGYHDRPSVNSQKQGPETERATARDSRDARMNTGTVSPLIPRPGKKEHPESSE